MSKTIKARLEALEASYKGVIESMLTVRYRDGSTRLESAGNCIELALAEPDRIDRFEEGRNSGNAGIMEGLLNALLIDTEGGNNE